MVSVRGLLRARWGDQTSPLSKSLEFLHSEYEPHVYFWELIDSSKKLVLVGFLSLPPLPGTTTQLIIAFVFSICYLMLQMQAAPFRRHEDDFLAMATSFSLVFVFFFCLILREDLLIQKLSDRLTRRDTLDSRHNDDLYERHSLASIDAADVSLPSASRTQGGGQSTEFAPSRFRGTLLTAESQSWKETLAALRNGTNGVPLPSPVVDGLLAPRERGSEYLAACLY